MTVEAAQTIFVVDDDEFVRESLCAVLEAHAFTVKTFASGSEFLAQRNGYTDGCLLLDIHMPGMSGIELLKSLRVRQDSTPAILITGRRDGVIEAQAKALGAAALLDKPVPSASLIAALRQALPSGVSAS